MKLRSYIIRDELNGSQALRFARLLGDLSLRDFDGIELSMSGATGLDVAGMAVLVRVYSQLERSGRRLVLRDVPAHVAEVFTRVGAQHMIASSVPVARPAFSFQARRLART